MSSRIEQQLGMPYVKRHDDGCDEAPSCLDCPLEVCIHDRIQAKKQRIKQMDGEPADIAMQLGVSVRTVYRALR